MYKCAIIYRANKLTSSTEEFIKKAKEKYGDKYNYSLVEYINSNIKVKIICSKGHIFEQKPNSHLYGQGCPLCYNKSSKSALLWLKYIESSIPDLQYHEKKGEYKIKKTRYSADGYSETKNTVYEFHGDFWHGNPKKFQENEFNNVAKKTFGELYKNTIKKRDKIIKLGYKYVEIWENDWNKAIKLVKIIQTNFKNRYKCLECD